ncbi:MAG TPA: hypothetical protein VHS96_14650 [Bacteroidia bacterium]|nr:hypothetical protein [Bacteroidia bacterium]
MKKTIYVFGSLLLLLTLAACDKETAYQKTLINQSSRALKVVVETTFGGRSDTIAVVAGETKIIDSFLRSGNDKQGFDCTEDLIDLDIVLPVGDSLVLELNNDANWTHVTTKEDSYLHDCQLTITDGNIQ